MHLYYISGTSPLHPWSAKQIMKLQTVDAKAKQTLRTPNLQNRIHASLLHLWSIFDACGRQLRTGSTKNTLKGQAKDAESNCEAGPSPSHQLEELVPHGGGTGDWSHFLGKPVPGSGFGNRLPRLLQNVRSPSTTSSTECQTLSTILRVLYSKLKPQVCALSAVL